MGIVFFNDNSASFLTYDENNYFVVKNDSNKMSESCELTDIENNEDELLLSDEFLTLVSGFCERLYSNKERINGIDLNNHHFKPKMEIDLDPIREGIPYSKHDFGNFYFDTSHIKY